MEKVTGIGGVFFRSSNPEILSQWYFKHLGVDPIPTSYDQDPWCQTAGPTVFAPFKQDTDYFGRVSQQWMLNFRVKDLTAMVEQLRQAGVDVDIDENEYPNGKFARLHDPEGNPIELWQPID